MASLPKARKVPTEAQLWKRIAPKLNKHGKAYRIEAISTPGFPDVVFIFKGDAILIELKTGNLKLRPAQVKFAADCHKHGLDTWVIRQSVIGSTPMVFQSRYLDEPGATLDRWILEGCFI